MKLDLYINVEPPDHEIGLAITTLEADINATTTKNLLVIPIGGIITIFQ